MTNSFGSNRASIIAPGLELWSERMQKHHALCICCHRVIYCPAKDDQCATDHAQMRGAGRWPGVTCSHRSTAGPFSALQRRIQVATIQITSATLWKKSELTTIEIVGPPGPSWLVM